MFVSTASKGIVMRRELSESLIRNARDEVSVKCFFTVGDERVGEEGIFDYSTLCICRC